MAGVGELGRTGQAGRRDGRTGLARSTRVVLAAVAAAVLGGCSVGVPDPSVRQTTPATPQPAAPTVTVNSFRN